MPFVCWRHKPKECKAPADQYKCINCMLHNRYSKADKTCENNTSLDRNCPSMHGVLAKHRQNTDY